MSGRVVQYKVLRDGFDTVYRLENEINKHIQQGWQPLGGIQVVDLRARGTDCAQSMVKYDKPQ
jgi:hypothetical protein